jgi:hypothetical protein
MRFNIKASGTYIYHWSSEIKLNQKRKTPWKQYQERISPQAQEQNLVKRKPQHTKPTLTTNPFLL